MAPDWQDVDVAYARLRRYIPSDAYGWTPWDRKHGMTKVLICFKMYMTISVQYAADGSELRVISGEQCILYRPLHIYSDLSISAMYTIVLCLLEGIEPLV
jgi:hypothetical protein